MKLLITQIMICLKKNFASSVQKYMNIFIKILEKIKNQNFSDNLVFAGGCALNSSANKFLTLSDKFFKNIYITFAPGDNGGALGAAFTVSANYGENKIILVTLILVLISITIQLKIYLKTILSKINYLMNF